MSFLGNDYRPRLWRTLIGGEKESVRKVRAMWTVRMPANHFDYVYVKLVEINGRDFSWLFLQPLTM